MTADGAYDGEAVYDAVVKSHPETAVIIPPRVSAVTSGTTATLRDQHIATIAKHGHGLAAPFGLQSTESGRDCDVPLQDHHRPPPSRLESAQSTDRGKNRVRRAEPDAGLRPDPMIHVLREEDATARFIPAQTR